MQDMLSYSGYTLVFEDHFDGSELDRGCWNVELHEPGWVNEELQEYVDCAENICLQDSNLLIRAIRTLRGGEVAYTSGRVSTQCKRDFTYGLFEARLKVPKGRGFLPAFWLMTTDESTYGQWPVCGEIDIMEIQGQLPQTNYGTIHYGLPHQQNQGTFTLSDGDFSESYHTFSLKWEPGILRWYVDGELFHEARQWFSAHPSQEAESFPAPFHHDMYIILNLAAGGNWVGDPDETTDFENAVLAVDYVRVYQKDNKEECV